MLQCSIFSSWYSKDSNMRRSDKQRRPPPEISSDKEPTFDNAAVCFGTWLGLLILVKLFELMPSLPMVPNPQTLPTAQMWSAMSFGF